MSKEGNMKRGKAVTPGIIFVAFIAAIIIFAVLLLTEKKALAVEEKTSVLCCIKSIPKGLIITDNNIFEYVEKKDIPVGISSSVMAYEMDELTGKRAVIDIGEGTIISKNMLEIVSAKKSRMSEPVLVGFKADDIYQVVCGVLRGGDRIHIYYEDEFGDILLKWEDVYIEAAFDASGNEIIAESESKASRFNIMMEKKDVEEFYRLLNSKGVRIVKICD